MAKIKLTADLQSVFEQLINIESNELFLKQKQNIKQWRDILKQAFGSYKDGNELYSEDGKTLVARWNVRNTCTRIFDEVRFTKEHPGIDIASYFTDVTKTVPVVDFRYGKN